MSVWVVWPQVDYACCRCVQADVYKQLHPDSPVPEGEFE